METINPLGPAGDFLAPGDRIHQVDGISTIGLTNQHVYSILCHGEGPAVIEIEYSLPEYSEYFVIKKKKFFYLFRFRSFFENFVFHLPKF